MSGIEVNQMVAKMRIMEALAKSQEMHTGRVANDDFSNALKQAIDNVNDKQVESKKLKTAYELGEPSVDLIQVMIAGQKSEVAFQAMLQVRNKMVMAYQEIMSMSV
jgi:flagellar hook-basal body complex protein FliE